MTMRLLNRLRLRSERGLALPLTVLVMATTGATVVTVIQFSSSSGRTSQVAKARVSAQSAAEAGIAHAFAVLSNAVDPKTGTLLPASPPTVVTVGNGTATFSGVYDSATFKWTITSIGSVPNPTGGPALKRTLTRTAQVHGLNSGASVGAWSRMFHDNTTTCMTVTDVVIPMPIASRGDLCLVGTAKITGAESSVEVGDDVRMTATAYQVDKSAGAGSGWTSSGNITSSNGVKASTVITGNAQSPNLNASSFGFAIPTGSVINGIRAYIERSASVVNVLDDDDVFLLKAGNPVGSDKAEPDWDYNDWDEIASYGGSTDLWGTTWTAAEINASTFGVRLQVDSDTSTSRTAYVDHIEIRIYYTPPPDTSIGTAVQNVEETNVGGDCTYWTQPAHTPCSTADKVYATSITTSPQGLSKPQIDMAWWYDNAKPGPKFPCNNAGGSFPGGFDNNTTYNNSLTAASEVTPTGSSYTCRRTNAQGTVEGEISWNHTTHVMTLKGTIFVDGDFRFDDNGQIVHYQGRGIIYAAGDIEFDELVCAGGTGTTSCVTQPGGMENWDPSQNMMTVLAGDDSEFDQGDPSDQDPATPSGLQGIIYARDDCTVHENFHLSGPIICDSIIMPTANNGWPTYHMWPPLGSLTEGQAYGSPNTAADFVVSAGDQLG